MKKLILITGLIIISIAVLIFALSGNNNGKEQKITINENNHMDYLITIKTNKGNIQFKTYAQEAPKTVENFITLADKGFYDGVIFHRVISGFMIQGGDPTGTGRGGPGYAFNDEINPSSKIYQDGYLKGIVAMANAGPNTQGSQFFIMVADYPLPPLYTIFGKVISGQEVAEAISLAERDVNDKPVEDVIIQSISVLKAEE